MTSEEKFHAAVNVIRSLPKNGSYQPSNELMLRFYGYFKQATLGPCKGARPAFWDVVGRAKYDAWARLGDMSGQAAMDAYVAELHRIVETMSYTDNVANFLEAQHELDSVNMGDLELVAGDVIERVKSQPNSPFASREASPTRLSPAVTPPLQAQMNSQESDHSDDEYIDTMDSEPETKLMNGHVEPVSNGHVSRSHTRTPKTNINAEIQRTIQSLQADLERLNCKVTSLEKARKSSGHKITFASVSPSLLAFIIFWPFAVGLIMRSIPQRK